MTNKDYQRGYMRKYRKGEKTVKDNGQAHLINRLNWKDILSYPGYAASDCGHILSKERTVDRSNGRKYKVPAVVMKANADGHGYKQVTLYKDTKRHTRQVARLVYEAWHGPIPVNKHVDHIDQNKLNNYADNLQLLTPDLNNRKKDLHAVKVCYDKGYAQGLEEARALFTEGKTLTVLSPEEILRYKHTFKNVSCDQFFETLEKKVNLEK